MPELRLERVPGMTGELIECEACGEVPFLVKLNGCVLVRCDCDDAVAIDSSEHPQHVPSSWQRNLG